MMPIPKIDSGWTIFLDRDGVINHEKHQDYIHQWDEFVFYDGVKEAIATFSSIFQRIIVVTNQRGVGKGVTQLDQLLLIHENMIKEISSAGGRIDRVYFCPDLDSSSPNRKPNPGMAFQAKNDFPEIDFNQSIMIGNTLSDMGFGRNIGAFNVFLNTTHPEVKADEPTIDLLTDSLISFSKILVNSKS